MFTKFSQVEDWIKDNGFKHWIFYAGDPSKRSDGERTNDKILDSKYFAGDIDAKLDLTKRYLESTNRTVYGVAWQTETATTGGCACEVRLDQQPQQLMPALQQPVGNIGAPVDEKAIEERLRKSIMAEFKAQKLEDDRKAFEQERREFNRDKASAVGLLVGYLKPLIDASRMKNVAGLDSPADVQAPRIVAPEQPQPQQPEQEEAAFTDDEADRIYALMAEFKSIEPDYLQLLEAVVKMAREGDSAYTMAKGVLLNSK